MRREGEDVRKEEMGLRSGWWYLVKKERRRKFKYVIANFIIGIIKWCNEKRKHWEKTIPRLLSQSLSPKNLCMKSDSTRLCMNGGSLLFLLCNRSKNGHLIALYQTLAQKHWQGFRTKLFFGGTLTESAFDVSLIFYIEHPPLLHFNVFGVRCGWLSKGKPTYLS